MNMLGCDLVIRKIQTWTEWHGPSSDDEREYLACYLLSFPISWPDLRECILEGVMGGASKDLFEEGRFSESI